MKINIWIERESINKLDSWLKESRGLEPITFFHHKPAKQMDLVQVSVSVDDYQRIVDNNESIQDGIAEEIGWVTTSTSDVISEDQLQILFGD
jgi:hypothetical protein